MRKNKLIILQIIVATILICTSVYATISTTIGISVSNTSIKRGETVTVTLSLKDVDNSKKVTSVDGYINYNTDIFETITVDSIQKDSDGMVQIGNEKLKVEDVTNAKVEDLPSSSAYIAFNGAPISDKNNTKIVIDFNNGINSNTDLLKIDFRVKSDATIGEVRNAITYSNFHITAGTEEIEVTENINLNIQQAGDTQDPGQNEDPKPDDKNENENQNQNENKNENQNQNENKNENRNENQNQNENKNENKNDIKNENKNTNRNINNNSNRNSNENDNRASGILPATGAKMMVVPAIVLIIIACVCYNKYIKYKDI